MELGTPPYKKLIAEGLRVRSLALLLAGGLVPSAFFFFNADLGLPRVALLPLLGLTLIGSLLTVVLVRSAGRRWLAVTIGSLGTLLGTAGWLMAGSDRFFWRPPSPLECNSVDPIACYRAVVRANPPKPANALPRNLAVVAMRSLCDGGLMPACKAQLGVDRDSDVNFCSEKALQCSWKSGTRESYQLACALLDGPCKDSLKVWSETRL